MGERLKGKAEGMPRGRGTMGLRRMNGRKTEGRKGGVSEKVIQAPVVILLCQAWLIESGDN